MPSRVDPTLPTVDLHELVCPGCGQTLACIKGPGSFFLPERHYRAHMTVCEYDDRGLAAVVFRAQRHAAGLGAPRLVTS
jgi:hypothetical protein